MKRYTLTAIVALLSLLIGCAHNLLPSSEPLYSYTVTFIDQAADTPVNPAIKTVIDPATTIDELPPDPVKADYSFGGWWTGQDGGGTEFTASTEVTADITVYANWIAEVFLITYYLNGGSNNVGNPAHYTVNSDSITLLDPERNGCIFDGWYDNAGFSGNPISRIVSGSAGNVTLHAKWNPITYTITYYLNGGSNHAGNPADYTVDSGTITLLDPARTSSIFNGWYENSEFTGDRISEIASGSYGDIIVYAKWSYNDTYNLGLRDTGPADGWIFYINPDADTDGWKYLEAAFNDQTISVWGTTDFTVTGADGIAIGTGGQNTVDIIDHDTAVNKAADRCAGYFSIVSEITYDDWFLPSRDELNKIWVNLVRGTDDDAGNETYTPVGGFSGYTYWSSSEADKDNAYYVNLGNGYIHGNLKSSSGGVRSVRAF